MNIQIFGVKKCFDTKKAERYFKERKIKFQFVDLNIKALGKREMESIVAAVGIENLINKNSKEYKNLSIQNIRSNQIKQELLLNNAGLCVTPIVRNGKLATVGFKPEVWKDWE